MPILRIHTGTRGETNIEVFFDLVYAMFKVAVWHVRPWSRIAAIAFLVVFIPFATFLPDLLVGAVAAAIVLAVGISDPFLSKRRERAPHPQPTQRRSAARSKHR
jgi:hypothetical protein